ncbi:MAG: TonB family protein [Cellvibrionaceae bacterium]|nr:TonB family protein [Cellvibrionaceae bacterium]
MRPLSTIYFQIGLMLALFLPASSYAEPVLNGLAVHSELGKEQFIAGLYSSTLSSSAKDILLDQGEKRIEVKIVAERLSSRRFKRLWIEGMAINASAKELAIHSQSMANFSNFLKVKLATGDVFTVDRTAKNTQVSLNGSKLGTIADNTFFDVLLRTWIGPVPLSSDFRSNLLTQGKLNSGLKARYNRIQTSEERIKLVADSLRPQPAEEVETALAPVPAEEVNTEVDIALVPPNIVNPAPVAAFEPAVNSKPPSLNSDRVSEKPEPTPATKVAAAPPRPGLMEESLLDEEEEDIEFTAAGLLAESLYISKLKRWTNRHIRYPSRALNKGWEGNVRLLITIDRDGKVEATTVTEKPRYRDLEKAALKAVKKANPFPAMPEEVRGEKFRFSLPIVFVLR